MTKQVIEIDRSRWARKIPGKRSYKLFGETCLLNSRGNKCCLGFISSALGVEDHDLRDVGVPSSIKKEVFPLSVQVEGTWCTYYENTELSTNAITINDNDEIAPKDKERLLKELFKDHFTLKFVGRTPSK